MALVLNGSGTIQADDITLSGNANVTGTLTSTGELTGTLTGNADSATKLSTASGSAPSYSARAWVNFNGTGTVAINASGNVSSVTDNAVGRYTINFATAMSDANYSIGAWARNPTTTEWNITVGSFNSISAPSASALPIWCRDHGTTDTDGSIVAVQVFR